MNSTPPPGDDFAARLFGSIGHSPIATILTDPRLPDNPIVAANGAFARVTGYSVEESIGRNCRFLAGPRLRLVPSGQVTEPTMPSTR